MGVVSLPFLAAVLAVYYLLPHRAQNYWLLLASLAYYATWNRPQVVYLAVFVLINYLLGRWLAESGQTKRLWFAIALNLLALAILKYNDFFLDSFNLHNSSIALHILFPLGLSFMVLQAIAYLVDLHHSRLEVERDPIDFALYLIYFPKLISGPIERPKSFLSQLRTPRRVDNDLAARSLHLIVLGAFRKLVLANSLFGIMPTNLFQQPGDFPALQLAAWLLAYAFALLNDFAGYTAFVRGISGFFGIELSRNFNLPYLSRNFVEFWERWHISFTYWLRDYIYFPLSRKLAQILPNRRNLVSLALPPLVTMLASGLWHGVEWHFLLWGGLHGAFLAIERLPLFWGGRVVPPNERPAWRRGLGIGAVFILAVLAWLPFSLDIPLARDYLLGLFHWTAFTPIDPRLIALVILAVTLDLFQARRGRECFALDLPRWQAAGLLALAILLILFSTQVDARPPFVYQGF